MSALSTARDAPLAKIRVADVAPSHCASCFSQKPEAMHVDFNAAWDGPTFRGEVAGAPIVVTVDDLVICEECLTAAAKLLPDNLYAAELEQLEEENVGLRERLTGALQYIAKLEEAQEAKEVFDANVRPKKAPAKKGR